MAWPTVKTWADNELVTAALLNTELRDRMTALKDPPTGLFENWSSGFFTSLTGFTDLTGATATLVTNGGRLMVGLFGDWYQTAVGNTCNLTLLIDGNNVGDATNGMLLGQCHMVNGRLPFALIYLSAVLAAGSHTVKAQIKTSANSVYVQRNHFWVREVS